MNYEEFIIKNKWFDLCMFDFDKLVYGEVTRTHKKFLTVLKKIKEMNIVAILPEGEKLSFINTEGKKVGLAGIDKEYKQRLIKSNTFRKKDNYYIYTNNAEYYLEIVLTKKAKSIPVVIESMGTKFEFITISYDKESYIKKSIHEKNKKAPLAITPYSKEIFMSYVCYCTGGAIKNKFGVRIDDAQNYIVGVLDAGIYVTN